MQARPTGALALMSRVAGCLLAVAALSVPHTAKAQGPPCSRMQFEAVVANAAGGLRDLNAHYRPTFQANLRALKDKRGWSHDEFLRKAVPLVQDARIAEFDREASEHLARIQSMGAKGAAAKVPDCTQLDALKAHMVALVASQKAKWLYMLELINQELAK